MLKLLRLRLCLLRSKLLGEFCSPRIREDARYCEYRGPGPESYSE